ncbi:MAG: hypothetical protein ACJ72Z_11965, partial [Pyrinomonadaceae bacterium]
MPRIVKLDPIPVLPDDVSSCGLVITPHQAAAETLRGPHLSLRRIAEEALRRKNITVASEIQSRSLLKQAVFEADRKTDPAGRATQIRQILDTLLRTGIDPEELERFGSQRVKPFARTAAIYKKKLRALGLVDKEEVLFEAAKLTHEPQRLCIYGYFRARKEEIYFIDAIAGEGSVYFLPCHENAIFTVNRQWAERLEVLGWTLETEPAVSAKSGSAALRFIGGISDGKSNVRAHYFTEIEAEVRGVLSQIKELVLEGSVPSNIALVCRKAELYAPYVAMIAKEYSLPIDFQLKIPLSETRVGSFVQLVLESVVDEFPFEITARLIKHPCGPGLSDDQWANARRTHPSGFDAWTKIGVDLECLKWSEGDTLHTLIDNLSNALRRFDVRKVCGFSASESVSFNCFTDSLAELKATESDRQIPLQGFAAVIFELLNSTRTAFDPSAAGVSFYDPKILIGGRFD